MVKGYGGHKVMEDVGLDDTMHEMSTDEAHLPVNSCGSTPRKVPNIVLIMWKCRVCVLEVCDGDCALY